MNTSSPDPYQNSYLNSAVFADLRKTLVGRVPSSAVLADLLEKVNSMQETQHSPEGFEDHFQQFVARAEDCMTVVRPFFPDLVRFLPSHRASAAAARDAAAR